MCIGIDLGTSSVKLLLVDAGGKIRKSMSRGYPLFFPQNGWSEQRPEDWWEACRSGIRELLSEDDASVIPETHHDESDVFLITEELPALPVVD